MFKSVGFVKSPICKTHEPKKGSGEGRHKMTDAIKPAIAAINAYGDRLSKTVDKIAKADNSIKRSDLDLQDEIVDMILIEQGVKANVKVVQTADELQDQLIDIIS